MLLNFAAQKAFNIAVGPGDDVLRIILFLHVEIRLHPVLHGHTPRLPDHLFYKRLHVFFTPLRRSFIDAMRLLLARFIRKGDDLAIKIRQPRSEAKGGLQSGATGRIGSGYPERRRVFSGTR